MSIQEQQTPAPTQAELRKEHIIGVLCVLAAAACFALAGIFIKLTPWNALSVSSGRSIFAVAVILIYMRMTGDKLVVNKPTLLATGVNFIVMQTFVVANKLTSSANVIVLQFTEPIWVILLIWLIFRNKPTREAIITCVVVFAGIVCFFVQQMSPDGLLGCVLALISGVAYAGVFLYKKIPGCSFHSAILYSCALCFFVGLPSVVQETQWTGEVLFNLLVLGAVQQGAAYIFLGRGLDSVSPVTASLTSMLEPVLNPILAAIVLGETLGPLSIFGAVLVIGASTAYNVYVAKRGSEG